LKFKISILLICLLVSCEKPAPVSQDKPAPAAPHPTLASAQLALAKTHLENNFPQKALPYLQASLKTHPLPEARKLLDNTLASTRFSVPTLQLSHPFPVLGIASSGDSLFAAVGGPFPTVVRWHLTDIATVDAVLFPTESKTISHLVPSPSGKYLLVQRDSINLLCNAETLKPIASIGTLPPDLTPDSLQPFSQNSLLLGHPVASPSHSLTWHIRDAATGEILRSETLPTYPKPVSASFDNTTLIVTLENRIQLAIPLIGEIKKGKAKPPSVDHPAQPTFTFTFSGKTITRHQTFSPPRLLPPSPPLLSALTGYHLNPTTQSLEQTPIPNRLQTLSEFFPEIPPTLKFFFARDPLETRLAAAFPEKFPALSLPSRTQAEIVRQSFASGDTATILATISALPPAGLPTATALLLAHQSGDPALLSAVLEQAENVPEALRNITAPGTEVPDLAALRITQDWLGYETPDFSPVFKKRLTEKSTTLSSLNLSKSPTEGEIQTLFTKLLNPETLRQIGHPAIAEAATSAAHSLSHTQEYATSALKFTAIAERMGAHPAEILRIRATAFTSLADFASAHRSWLDLITNQPEASHLPTDYSEAAYTAFENADSRQAIEILETGIFRFPNDVKFAIRAGWIALLTTHPQHGAKYLSHAATLGLPPSEIENTTALLAIAHTQLGDLETASSYLAQLKAIDESWADPEAIEKLPWPEPLKQTLRTLTWSQQESSPEPSPESDPKDTAPQSEEFPILEPPLPSR